MQSRQATQSQAARIERHKAADGVILLKSLGDWTIDTLLDVTVTLERFSSANRDVTIEWDLSDLGEVDSAGMLLFIRHYDLLKSNNCSVEMTGIKDEHEKMYKLLRRFAAGDSSAKPVFSSRFLSLFDTIGRKTVAFMLDSMEFFAFIGEHFASLFYSLLHPRSFRFGAIVKNIEDAGVHAMPIVALTSFLIGVVIAYQGAVQLEKFGANVFIVDMISISVTRELAPLITAIVVAGRTGSFYTAQLGVMKITEEIDAMRKACETRGFGRTDVEDLFYNNAAQVLTAAGWET